MDGDKAVESTVAAIVARIGRDRDRLLPLLQAIQKELRYLPPEALQCLADATGIPPAEITGVSTFYAQFRHQPAGRHTISVCIGTACHVKGADRVHEAFRRHLDIPAGRDVDANLEYTLERVGCLGCCMLAPAVRIDEVTYGHVAPDGVGEVLRDFHQTRRQALSAPAVGSGLTPGGEARICLCSSCLASGAQEVYDALLAVAAEAGIRVRVKEVGCTGLSVFAPLVEICTPDGTKSYYRSLSADDVPAIILRHFRPGLLTRLRLGVRGVVERILLGGRESAEVRCFVEPRDPVMRDFLGPQLRIASEGLAEGEPLGLDEYRKHGGFAALRRALLERTPEEVLAVIEASGLRGRGGAGFPTAGKMRAVRAAAGSPKSVICNGDEGDPGAFMDRMLLESCPLRVLEGILLAGYVVGASRGILYIRAEYPVAVERVRAAIALCRAEELLGANILGTPFCFELEVVEGAGAFVCGEETALLASLEGRRGMPRLKPPYPSEKGWRDLPTLINNVETCALIPWIMRNGAEAFGRIGTASSRGTKVFSLAGKVERGGLIEVPMGTTIRQIVDEIGGGVADGGRLKAVQIGGPSGGCVPAELADIPVDYEALAQAGVIMGSGGIVVLDEHDCMVDIARYFLSFTQAESCGRCAPCRVGTRRMLDILEALCAGKATARDLARLEELALMVGQTSLCGLGQSAPNPVLSTLRHFRAEYEAHLAGRCPAGSCTALIAYRITDKCIGCALCARHCPVGAIAPRPYRRHEIDTARCVRCGGCRALCPQQAVEVVSPCPE